MKYSIVAYSCVQYIDDKQTFSTDTGQKLAPLAIALHVRLEDAMFEVTEERKEAKLVVEKLAKRDAALKKIEHEAGRGPT